MNQSQILLIGLLLPLLGTGLGSGMVFFMRGEMNLNLKKALLGFAGGVMIAASIWSLLIPSIEMAKEAGQIAWLPALIGFLCGMGFLLVLDTFVPHLHLDSSSPEGAKKQNLSKSAMFFFAVTLHNIPEGMVAGVVFAGMISDAASITVPAALVLALGIAIQNFPEGAIISMPMASNGLSRPRAFAFGFLSGVVEPLGAMATILLTSLVVPALPYFLSFAAGAMIYVVVEELIPEAQEGEHSNLGTIGVALGFSLMMVLDIALG